MTMTLQGYFDLAWRTVTDPRSVARYLMSLRLGAEAVVTAFALVVVLNALVFALSLAMVPAQGALPLFLASSTGFIAMQAMTLAGMILAMTWMGRMFGGHGRMNDVAVLLIWMQGLRVLVQAATLLMLLLGLGALSGLVVLVASGLGIWIFLNFVDEAHGLGGLGRAAMVIVLGLVAFAFLLSLVLTMLGFTPEGMMGNV